MSTTPPTPPPRSGPPKGLLIALGVLGLVVAVVVAFALGRRSAGPTQPAQPGQPVASGDTQGPGVVQALPPAPSKPLELEVLPDEIAPAVWVDVHAPQRVRQALMQNAWLREQLDKPLGQGFAGGWRAFFGSSGEDLNAAFKGAMLDVVTQQLLDTPFRLAWLSGQGRVGTPAVILPKASPATLAAFEALEKSVRRGEAVAQVCPGGEVQVPEGGLKVGRWLVAEQALWAGRMGNRLVLARHPLVVIQGLCLEEVELKPTEGVDVEVGVDPELLGRESQLLAHVLGLDEDTRLQFAVEGNRLVARGIAGQLEGEPRLDSAPLSDDLLRLVPEETPVLLALQLKLPQDMGPQSLQAWLAGEGKGPTLTRQVALLWTPRGDAALPTEVAIAWGRTEDAPALAQLFSGNNPLVSADLCKHRVLASSQEVLARMRKACEGKSPNLLNAAAPVVQGLRAPTSVAFGVHTGRLLGLLAMDGYRSEAPASPKSPIKAAPPEVEAARRDLESLPYIGLRGTVQGDKLVPGGFGS